MRGALVFAAALTLCGCGAKTPPPPSPEQALALRPADPRLAALYETSCHACHAVPGTGAPLVHDRADWNKRWKQGEATLLDHAIQGYNAMPATGQCATCTPDDFRGLIRFMAGREDSGR